MREKWNSRWRYDESGTALGYSGAVVGAAICFAVEIAVWDWLSGLSRTAPMQDRLWQFLLLEGIETVVFGVLAPVCGLLPFVVSIAIARRFTIRFVGYYIVGGVLSAIALSPLFAWVFPYDLDMYGPPPFWYRCLVGAAVLALPAVTGALVFWLTHGRFMSARGA